MDVNGLYGGNHWLQGTGNGLYGYVTTGYRELVMVYMDVPLATGNHRLQGTVNGLYGRTTGYRELVMVYMDVPLATGNW